MAELVGLDSEYVEMYITNNALTVTKRASTDRR